MAASSARDTVVLSDHRGRAVGQASKRDAHQPPGVLHLAISVFLYRPDGAVLLQQRAATKYHFPGVWANACCSHPTPGESSADAAVARVREELGVDVALEPAGSFIYRAPCGSSGLVEHEFDSVFIGVIDTPVDPDPLEVAATAYATVDDLRAHRYSGELAPWFFPAFELAERARQPR